jgi:hypothetical protein
MEPRLGGAQWNPNRVGHVRNLQVCPVPESKEGPVLSRKPLNRIQDGHTFGPDSDGVWTGLAGRFVEMQWAAVCGASVVDDLTYVHGNPRHTMERAWFTAVAASETPANIKK